MNEYQILDRATKATAILENPVYQEAWDSTRLAIIALIEKTPMSEVQTAEDLRRCLKLLRDVRLNLELFMKQGKVASFNLAAEKSRKDNPLRNLFR